MSYDYPVHVCVVNPISVYGDCMGSVPHFVYTSTYFNFKSNLFGVPSIVRGLNLSLILLSSRPKLRTKGTKENRGVGNGHLLL